MALSRAKTFTRQKKTAVLQAMKERKYQLPVAIFDVREVNVLVFKVPNKDLRNYESNRFNEQNNNSALASRFFVYFFAVPAQLRREMAKF